MTVSELVDESLHLKDSSFDGSGSTGFGTTAEEEGHGVDGPVGRVEDDAGDEGDDLGGREDVGGEVQEGSRVGEGGEREGEEDGLGEGGDARLGGRVEG